ncbi:MAG TPA: YceD family protein [Streptosporangiaceae bacterium]|nr:YceD family protein [Streptosporangiaceae bacterium]
MPSTRTSQARGPRGPLVFDLRSLSRQAGSARSESRMVPAPEDLRLELVRVPVGSEVQLSLKFEAVTEGVLVSGTATAPVAGECARCLGPVDQTVTVSFLELYRYCDERPGRARDRERESGLDDDEDEERFLDGDLLDLEPAFRDAVVLALPMSPLCREDCPGLCVDCGVPLAEAGPGHTHEGRTDPRWAGLEKLQSKEG